jgi:hypothetical protein
LEALLPPDLVFNWKAHYLEVQKANPSSIFSFFGKPAGQSPAKGAKPVVVEADESEGELERVDEKSSLDKKRGVAPVATAVAPSPQKKAKATKEPSKGNNNTINSFFKKKDKE